MMPMIARISSRWMRPPATWSEKPSNHNTKRTTTTVQIRLTMKNLRQRISCYVIASISDCSPVLPDGHNRASEEIAGDFESAAAVCDRAASVGEDWPETHSRTLAGHPS